MSLSSWDDNYADEHKLNLSVTLWDAYFKKPIDTMPRKFDQRVRTFREYYFGTSWKEVYDLIEYVAQNYEEKSENEYFMNQCNDLLKEELSAYRFVNGFITEITSEEEIKEIEEASTVSDPVREHIDTAIKHLSNKKNPDYRNSIKESISAVESYCQVITNDRKATLGKALKMIENKISLHPSLKGAFDKLYGYTSDAHGIRHALMDLPDLDFEDAKYMLVSCSAFINYLKTKHSKISQDS